MVPAALISCRKPHIEREQLDVERKTLDAERETVVAENQAAVNTYNARVGNLDARVQDWNQRNAQWNEASKALEIERQDWVDQCGNRRYREDDEKAIRAGR